MSSLIKKFFKEGHERTIKVKKNIAISFFFKGLSIVINLAFVPLTLNYLNPTYYGVWLTIGSIAGMLNFFDIGLGNGLRNKFAESRAKGLDALAREYVSTTYAALTIISAILFISFTIIHHFINWNAVLNVPQDNNTELAKVVYIVFSFYFLQFVLSIIGTILNADQKSSINNFFNFLYTLLSFIVVYFLNIYSQASLYYLSLALAGIPSLVFFVSSLYLFNTTYKKFSPKLEFVQIKHLKIIARLGISFFIIQLNAIILFSTGNIIITQTLSPAEVTPYNIAFKYFGVITMGYNIFVTPFWSGFTDAYHRGDKQWIKRTMKNLNLISIGIAALLFIMVIFSNYIYTLWVGTEVKVPFRLSVLMAFYVLITTWMIPFVYFMNGIGKLKLQLFLSIITCIINIPISIFFSVTMELGITGIILGPIICITPYALLMPIQYDKVINNKAKGIWNG